MRLILVIFSLTIAASTAIAQAPPDPVPGPESLEARGAVIRDIQFRIRNIFDTANPKENKRLYRLANRLHVLTRESTVRSHLLFRSGDRYSRRVVAETERKLRSLEFLYDARIIAVRYENPFVDLVVETRDVWTLQPGFSFDRKGGETASEFELEEENLLGYGKSIAISRQRDVDRRSLMLQWRDPNIAGSRWRNDVSYSANDDGHYSRGVIERPFYSLDARWSLGFAFEDGVRVDPHYDLGEVLDEFRHQESTYEVYGGFSRGLMAGWTRRWLAGWRYRESRFDAAPGRPPPVTLPPDVKLSYPWIGMEWVEEDYEKTRNLNQINRTEDLNYGRSLRLELGWSQPQWGGEREALIIGAAARDGVKIDARQFLFASADVSGRLESGVLVNGMLSGNLQYYWRWNPQRVFAMSLDAAVTQRLDLERQVLLGGDSGLRGYPLRYQTGTSRALFSMEQRFYTDWFPFRLFYVGAAVFFDAGRTWGRPPVGSESLGLLKDVGVGLRLGNARSAFGNVLHIDVAFPLDRQGDIDAVQFIVETKRSF